MTRHNLTALLRAFLPGAARFAAAAAPSTPGPLLELERQQRRIRSSRTQP